LYGWKERGRECIQFCGKIGTIYLEIKHVYPISSSGLIDITSFAYYETDRKKNERTYILSGLNKTQEGNTFNSVKCHSLKKRSYLNPYPTNVI
jgi:hypothetical protein